MSSPQKVDAREAIRVIQPGQRVFIGQACAEPQSLIDALVEDKEQLRGIQVVTGSLLGGAKYAQKGMEDYFRIVTFLVTPDTRETVAKGKADFLPVRLFDIPSLFSGSLPLDVALIQVSPPDKEGLCSLGVSVSFTLEAALKANTVIAEVNEQMPYTYGNSLLPLSRLDYIVESSRPLLTLPPPHIGEEERALGRNVSELIPDGATLQIGLGAIPEAILRSITEKSNLGLHTGMIGDGLVDLVEQGIVTNAKKTIDAGKSVTALLVGSERLYRFAHNNPLLEMHPATYTHNLKVIAQLDNFISINSAVEIDLSGQVNAESLGVMQLSGVGGQADFVMGAALSNGGKSIIAMTSTARDGRVSRIVPRLGEGTIVTTPRHDVQFVVTDFGIAELKGKNLSQRAKALISIAHPNFRDQLSEAASLSGLI